VPSVPLFDEGRIAGARRVFDRIEQAASPAQRQVGLMSKHLTHREVWDLATDPRTLDAVESVVGGDIVLLGTHFFVKYPNLKESFVAWHQDVTYWGLQPPQAVSIWLAIDDADVENGCMRVIPGSHLGGLLPHGVAAQAGNLLSVNQEIPAQHIDAGAAVDLPLRAGWASLHDGLLVHGSNPNRSQRRRCGLTIRYTTPGVRVAGDANFKGDWKPILVRGTDRFKHGGYVEAPF
jgi:ectoine hydroxylase-related dioxygenase (phytanoyl-CoA dioxygenase family)